MKVISLDRFIRFRCQFERKSESRTHTEFTLERDLAIKLVRDLFADVQSEADSFRVHLLSAGYEAKQLE